MSKQPRIGLMLSGGAARGAFQAGVVSAFAESKLHFDCIVGTSVGAVNGAAFLLDHGPELATLWKENLREVKWFDRRRIWRGRSPFLISEAMRIMVERYGQDFHKIRNHRTEMLVSVTKWGTTKNLLFSSKEKIWSDEEVTLQFLASLTIPIICTEKIIIRGQRYCDGALSNNMPLEVFLQRGYEHVVIVDPSPNIDNRKFRLLKALRRPLEAIPTRGSRIFAGFIRAVTDPTPQMPAPMTVWEITPPDSFSNLRSLDFLAHEALDDLIDCGFDLGMEYASKLLSVKNGQAVQKPFFPHSNV